MQHSAIRCNRPAGQPVATQCRLLQPVADCCNLLQIVATCCSVCNAVPSAATERSPLQQCVMCCVAYPGCEGLESVCKSRSPLQRSHHGPYERLPSARWRTRSTHTWVLPSDDTTTTACTSGGSRACRPVDLLLSPGASMAHPSAACATRGTHCGLGVSGRAGFDWSRGSAAVRTVRSVLEGPRASP